MRRLIFCFLLLTFLMGGRARAAIVEGEGTGVGIVVGDPTGFTSKFWQNGEEAFVLSMAWAFGNFFVIISDYVWHFPNWFKSRQSNQFVIRLDPYVGLGVELMMVTASGANPTNRRFWGDSPGGLGMALRVPFGVEWLPLKPPFGVYAELAPGVGFMPTTWIMVQVGMGIRYYF